MKEKEHIYEVEIERSFFTENGVLKPYIYQNLFSQVVERHLSSIGMSYEVVLRHGLAWVLVSASFEIKKAAQPYTKLFAQTWYSQRKGPFFRREIVFKDGEGDTVLCGSTFSVLINLHTRSVYRQAELPFLLSDPLEEFMVTASPLFKSNAVYAKIGERKVYNSHIDFLGHVNNCRYGEFAYDALDGEELFRLAALERIDIFFISELRNSETVTIGKAWEANKLMVRGTGEKGVAFDYIMTFAG